MHLAPGMRAFVSEVYPLDDAATMHRARSPPAPASGCRMRCVWEPPVPIEITGSAALYSSARLHRFRRFIPRGTAWTHAQGVLVEAQQDGTRGVTA